MIVGIDIETTMRNGDRSSPYTDDILCITVNDGSSISVARDVQTIEPILVDPSILKVFQNGAFDIQFLESRLWDARIENVWDTMIAERLLTAGFGQGCDLSSLTQKYCGVETSKDIRDTFSHHMGELSSTQIEYAKGDVRYLLDIQRQQERNLKERGMLEVMDLENRLVPIVARMELAGIGFNPSVWDRVLEEETRILPELEEAVQRQLPQTFTRDLFTGRCQGTVNLNSPTQVLDALHRLGIDVSDTNESTLLKCSHPVAKAILNWREHQKRLTWDYPKYVNKVTGRIHPDYQQTGARTGRFSCKDPNLQNVPYEKLFRSMFVPKEGYVFVIADYDQQELRVLAELSGDEVLRNACKGDPHLENARLIYDDQTIQKSDNRRRLAKTCAFALVYGASLKTFAESAGVSIDEVKEPYKRMKRAYIRVDRWGNESLSFLVSHGYIVLPSGRRRYFPGVAADPGKYATIARNTPIQGTSADMVKLAMIYIAKGLEGYDAQLVLCVHDEVVVEARRDQAEAVAAIVEEKMREAGSHYVKSVPVTAEAVISEVWNK